MLRQSTPVMRLVLAGIASSMALTGCLHRRSASEETSAPAAPTFAQTMCMPALMTDTSGARLVDRSDFTLRVPSRLAEVNRGAFTQTFASGEDSVYLYWGPQDPNALAIARDDVLMGQCEINAESQSADVILYRRTIVDQRVVPTSGTGPRLLLRARWADLTSNRQVLFIGVSHYTEGMQRIHDVLWSLRFKPLPVKP